mmetsp:Transcript_116443/g.238188  ORF Transcript_116443/g.238188 Transcript_116443/m.238188 type:complete len:98 (+) Transcript_116443:151-444(+)
MITVILNAIPKGIIVDTMVQSKTIFADATIVAVRLGRYMKVEFGMITSVSAYLRTKGAVRLWLDSVSTIVIGAVMVPKLMMVGSMTTSTAGRKCESI